jgi:4-hydroxy-tetrahydrodipicolinate synthase
MNWSSPLTRRTLVFMLYVPLVTPFATSGAVDLDALSSLASGLLSDGATGLVALGTTGEPSSLSLSEREAVLSVVAAVCAARGAPLLVGANSAAELAALAGRPEVTAALTLVPPFVRPGPEGVLAYFTQLAAASAVPLVVYHVPPRTGQDLSPAFLGRLAALPSVVGMKYAPGVLSSDSVELFASLPSFPVYCGDDALLCAMLALGASGAIAASAHLATASYACLITSFSAPLGHRLGRLSSALFAEPNPTVIKGVLYAQGRIPTPSVRLPLLPASPSTVDHALSVLGSVPSFA